MLYQSGVQHVIYVPILTEFFIKRTTECVKGARKQKNLRTTRRVVYHLGAIVREL